MIPEGTRNEVIGALEEVFPDDPQAIKIGIASRVNRTRVPAPFPVHRWREFVPDIVVLPKTSAEVAHIVQIANRFRVPVVPRAGGTGLADGAVPLHGGIVLDVKRMNAIVEMSEADRTIRVQAGINMQRLNNWLLPFGYIYPDDPSSYPCAMVGGRIGANGWSYLAGRFGHTRDLVVSLQVVLPTGEVVELGDGGGRRVRKSSTGFQLKQLFIGHQGTLGIVTEATLELVKRPEAQFVASFGYPDFASAYAAGGALARSGLATLAGATFTDERHLDFVRRIDPSTAVETGVASVATAVLYGVSAEVRAASEVVMGIGAASGGTFLGDAESERDWSMRHTPPISPLHGRLPSGEPVVMSWHVQDAACPYETLPRLHDDWHGIMDRYVERYGIFDDWGMAFYTNAAYKPWADFAATLEAGIWEQELDDERWEAWIACERELSLATIRHGGSISAAHGSTRPGTVDAMPIELGNAFDLMKRVKVMLDPHYVMNPGKFLLDDAYADTSASRAAL